MPPAGWARACSAYELLRTTDPVKAFDYAARLETLNNDRRRLTDATLIEAEQQLAGLNGDDPALVTIASQHFLPGIVGLVAGKLSERFYRPAVVVEQGVDSSRGSARSIPELDIDRGPGPGQRHAGTPWRPQQRGRLYRGNGALARVFRSVAGHCRQRAWPATTICVPRLP